MRDIKFRAWLAGEHKAVGGGTLCCSEPKMEENVSVVNGSYAWVKDNGWDAEKIQGVYPTVPLMQFTGLTDRDGTDIYQGDLLEVTADVEEYGTTSYGGIVEVTKETCSYKLKPIRPTFEELEAQGKPWDSTSMWHVCEGQTTRVIGNVHQNPELLNPKEN